MINKLVNYIIKKGNKNVSTKVLKDVFINLKNSKLKGDINKILKSSFISIQPRITFVNKKIAGVVHKVPKPYENIKKLNTSSKWIVQSSKKRSEIKCKDKLSNEIIESLSKKSLSFKKKVSLHKLGLANRTNLKYL